MSEQAAEWLSGLEWQAVDADEFKALPANEQLRRIRHSSAHVMATALQNMFAEVEFAIGPPTDQGFFYDVRGAEPLDQEQLSELEAAMTQVANEKQPFEVTAVSKEAARDYFAAQGQSFKLQILERITDEEVTLYRNGPFVDLCAGPHAPHTGFCRHVRLLNVSSAHWQQEEHPSLTRISGTAWPNPKALKVYLRFLEEVKARDHRVLGQQLDLFSFHPWAAAALWHPNGLVLRHELMRQWREVMADYDYQEILNPILYRKELFETSGHWDHFQEDIFTVRDEDGDPSFILKPMNCPDTMLYYKTQSRSYRELPLRIAEGQVLHRNEASGSLHGLLRTRTFVQDDAHIFCRHEDVQAEFASLLAMLDEIYTAFGLDDYQLALATRPESFLGEAETWDKAEADLRAALEARGKEYSVDPGGGAFYGPKIDVTIRDSLGRQWQCGTLQLDFQLPQRFDLKYADADGSQKQPVVIHRAIFGSFERFLGVLIEHFAGAFPTWLAPVQAMVLPISDEVADYGNEVLAELRAAGVRAGMETEGSVNYRIRAAEKRKVPYMLVVGGREREEGTVAVRQHRVKRQRVIARAEVLAELESKISERTFDAHMAPLESPFDQDLSTTGEEEAAY